MRTQCDGNGKSGAGRVMKGVLRAVAGFALALGAMGVSMSMVACEADDDYFDVTPPAIPSGVNSITGDQEVILFWTPNREPDLAGYRIYWNEDGGDAFEFLVEFSSNNPDYYDAGSGRGDDFVIYSDRDVFNGDVYWYAVTSFDRDGNESDLSFELVRDVPRPEGDVILQANDLSPQFSGFDFQRAAVDPSAQDWTLESTDVWFEVDGAGVPYLFTPLFTQDLEVRIQDYGVVGFDVATYAPVGGWSRTGVVEAITGHTYVLEITRDPNGTPRRNYAKLWVYSVDGTEVDMMWGYQENEDEREFKNSPEAILPPTEEVQG